MEGTSPNETENTGPTVAVNGVPAESLLEHRNQPDEVGMENQHAQNPLQLKRGYLIVAAVAVLGVCCLYVTSKSAKAEDSKMDKGIRIEGTVSIRRM